MLRYVAVWMLCAVGAAQAAQEGIDGDAGAHAGSRPERAAAFAPIFVENQGQFGEGVRYRSLLASTGATVTDDGLVLSQVRTDEHGVVRGNNVLLRFEAANETLAAPPVGGEPAITRASYILGDDASAWVSDVATWKSVRYEGVAPGIAAEIHGRNGYLEYDLHVAPGVASTSVEVVLEGAVSLDLHDDGGVQISTPLGSIRQLAPRSWELTPAGEQRPLPSRAVVVAPNRLRFAVEGRTAGRALVIDPGLVYSTFIGAEFYDISDTLAVDADGSAYVVGATPGIDFPVTPGAFQPDITQTGGTTDLVALKLTPSGADLAYATYVGGTGVESVFDAEVDGEGQLLFVGTAKASDYPTTQGAYAEEMVGTADDAFITKLNPLGTALTFSTLFGGAEGAAEGFTCVTTDPEGRVVVGGVAGTADLPITPSAIQRTLPEFPGGFIARFSPDVSELDYCTYVGSTSVEDVVTGVDSAIHATGVGHSSSGLPTTPGAFQEDYAGSTDAFALKLAPDGSLVWASILGSTKDDRGFGIGLDPEGRVIVAGRTSSFFFPTTPGAFDEVFNGSHDRFVTKFGADGTSLVWSTFVGGVELDHSAGFAVDALGASFLATRTSSANMPVTPNGFDTVLTPPSLLDAHVAKLSPDGSELQYASFLGGGGSNDEPRALAVDPQGNIYLTGTTSSTDFPTTPDAYDDELYGFSDIFVAKFDLSTWTWIDHALPPLNGPAPRLTAAGSLQPFSAGSMHVDRAKPFSVCTVVIGLSSITLPFKGGVMVPAPDRLLSFPMNAEGELHVAWAEWPEGLPEGLDIWFQAWSQDADSWLGYTASNALTATIPEAD